MSIKYVKGIGDMVDYDSPTKTLNHQQLRERELIAKARLKEDKQLKIVQEEAMRKAEALEAKRAKDLERSLPASLKPKEEVIDPAESLEGIELMNHLRKTNFRKYVEMIQNGKFKEVLKGERDVQVFNEYGMPLPELMNSVDACILQTEYDLKREEIKEQEEEKSKANLEKHNIEQARRRGVVPVAQVAQVQ